MYLPSWSQIAQAVNGCFDVTGDKPLAACETDPLGTGAGKPDANLPAPYASLLESPPRQCPFRHKFEESSIFVTSSSAPGDAARGNASDATGSQWDFCRFINFCGARSSATRLPGAEYCVSPTYMPPLPKDQKRYRHTPTHTHTETRTNTLLYAEPVASSVDPETGVKPHAKAQLATALNVRTRDGDARFGQGEKGEKGEKKEGFVRSFEELAYDVLKRIRAAGKADVTRVGEVGDRFFLHHLQTLGLRSEDLNPHVANLYTGSSLPPGPLCPEADGHYPVAWGRWASLHRKVPGASILAEYLEEYGDVPTKLARDFLQKYNQGKHLVEDAETDEVWVEKGTHKRPFDPLTVHPAASSPEGLPFIHLPAALKAALAFHLGSATAEAVGSFNEGGDGGDAAKSAAPHMSRETLMAAIEKERNEMLQRVIDHQWEEKQRFIKYLTAFNERSESGALKGTFDSEDLRHRHGLLRDLIIEETGRLLLGTEIAHFKSATFEWLIECLHGNEPSGSAATSVSARERKAPTLQVKASRNDDSRNEAQSSSAIPLNKGKQSRPEVDRVAVVRANSSEKGSSESELAGSNAGSKQSNLKSSSSSSSKSNSSSALNENNGMLRSTSVDKESRSQKLKFWKSLTGVRPREIEAFFEKGTSFAASGDEPLVPEVKASSSHARKRLGTFHFFRGR